jgi:hypothetical protein
MADPPIGFVAYSSRDAACAELIGNAVYVANGKSDRVQYETWVYNDIPGTPLISPSLDRIEESAFIIADVTTLNLNVVYETGFAIRPEADRLRFDGSVTRWTDQQNSCSGRHQWAACPSGTHSGRSS